MPTDTGGKAHPTLLVDSSAAIALIIQDHEAHSATLAAATGHRLGLAGHGWFETYSVLTRLPSGQRHSPQDAVRLLTRNFPASSFLAESEAASLGTELARLGIAGGAVYDALVAAAARQHQLPLLSADIGARSIYEALGVKVKFIG